MSMPLTLAEGQLQYVFIAAGVVLVGWALLSAYRKTKDSSPTQLDPHERIERMKQMGGMRNDLQSMMVELEELTRRFSAQLDNKANRLERLLDQADERIEELRRLQGEGGATAKGRDDRDAATTRSVDRPARSAPAAPPTSGPVEVPASASDSSSGGGGAETLADEVYRLADEGREPGEIARELDEHVGKVELILALRQPS